MTLHEHLLHGSNLTFCEQYYGLNVEKMREMLLERIFFGDCWRDEKDFGSTAEWDVKAVPCASDVAKRLEAA